MKICKKCKTEFSGRIKDENGNVHNIPCRSYCFVCSPFKSKIKIGRNNNPTTEIKNDKTYRICSICHKSKEEYSNFYKRKRGGFNSYCKVCSTKDIVKRTRQLKVKAIQYKGGKCVICGYSKCSRSLDFHHINPTQKEFSMGERTTNDFEKIKIELDKCILICKNCHGELHDGLITITDGRIVNLHAETV